MTSKSASVAAKAGPEVKGLYLNELLRELEADSKTTKGEDE